MIQSSIRVMAKRQYCPTCHYPVTVCICRAIKPFTLPIQLTILQHPGEAQHAKNTARLVKLAIPSTQIIVGESPQDFSEIIAQTRQTPKEFALIYPNQQSELLTQPPENKKQLPFKHLLFIDATWRKAFKIWKLNPWLEEITSLHFDLQELGNYRIRKAPVEHQLSTLEAVSWVLENGYSLDCSPLSELFDTWQQTAFAKHLNVKSSMET